MNKNPVIVIDGPAGSGKSTVSKILAARLKYLYLDTGALYRAAAYLIARAGVSHDDEKAVAKILTGMEISLQQSPQGMRVVAGGEDVTEYLRREEIGVKASQVSAIPLVRNILLPVQRQAAETGGIVAEGRDMGTVVFPEADIKFYFDAAERERINRRFRELSAGDRETMREKVADDLRLRDRQDRERQTAPLRPHAEAIIIDTTNMSIPEVVEALIKYINSNLCREFA